MITERRREVNDLIGIVICAISAGIIQGMTGFGAGIVMMVYLPSLFTITQSAGVSAMVVSALCTVMVIKYRNTIQYRKVVVPFVIYAGMATVAITFSDLIDQSIMKKLLGLFLLILSGYFFAQKSKKGETFSWVKAGVFISLSGIFSGLFGIGGPLMAVYFLSLSETKEMYLGTIQFFFFINTLYTLIIRMLNGIITTAHLPIILVGMISILIGLLIALKFLGNISLRKMKVLIHFFIGLSGLYYMFM